MKSKANTLKWITFILLALSIVLFFLPYLRIAGDFNNPIQLLEMINENRGGIRGDAAFEVVFSFIVPVALTVLSAFLMVFKICVPRSIISSILNALSVGIYLLFFSQTFFDTSSGNVGFGLIGNVVIACLGIVLPIVTVILHKSATKNSQNEA